MELIKKYFPDLKENQLSQLENYSELLLDWNSRINLISRKDDELQIRHILHSLAINNYASLTNESVLDIGSGGGLPGIPLAITNPNCHFTLCDSIGKKMKAVGEMVNELELTNVDVIHERAENLNQKFDVVVIRAVARTSVLLDWCKDITHGNSVMYALKGGDLREEMETVDKTYQIFNIADKFSEPFFETKKLVYIEM